MDCTGELPLACLSDEVDPAIEPSHDTSKLNSDDLDCELMFVTSPEAVHGVALEGSDCKSRSTFRNKIHRVDVDAYLGRSLTRVCLVFV